MFRFGLPEFLGGRPAPAPIPTHPPKKPPPKPFISDEEVAEELTKTLTDLQTDARDARAAALALAEQFEEQEKTAAQILGALQAQINQVLEAEDPQKKKKRLRKKRGGFDPEEEAEYIAMAMKVNADHAKARAKAEAHAAKKREQERAKAAHHDKADAATKGEEDTSLKPKDKGKKRARDEDDGYTSGGDASVQATSTPKRPKTTEVQINQVVHEDIQVTNGFKESVLPSQTPSQAGPSTSSIAGAPQDFLKAVPNVNDIAPSESSSVVPTLTPESSTATQAVTRPTAEKANTPSPSLAPSGSSGDGARALKPIPKHTPGSLSRTRPRSPLANPSITAKEQSPTSPPPNVTHSALAVPGPFTRSRSKSPAQPTKDAGTTALDVTGPMTRSRSKSPAKPRAPTPKSILKRRSRSPLPPVPAAPAVTAQPTAAKRAARVTPSTNPLEWFAHDRAAARGNSSLGEPIVHVGLKTPARVADWRGYRVREVFLGDRSASAVPQPPPAPAEAARLEAVFAAFCAEWARAAGVELRGCVPALPPFVAQREFRVHGVGCALNYEDADTLAPDERADLYIGKWDKRELVRWDPEQNVWFHEVMSDPPPKSDWERYHFDIQTRASLILVDPREASGNSGQDDESY